LKVSNIETHIVELGRGLNLETMIKKSRKFLYILSSYAKEDI
jgi:hypothetical protein